MAFSISRVWKPVNATAVACKRASVGDCRRFMFSRSQSCVFGVWVWVCVALAFVRVTGELRGLADKDAVMAAEETGSRAAPDRGEA